MQGTPNHRGGPGDHAHASDAVTPGASVAAQFGGGDALDTHGFETPGQASPARNRSQEGGRSQQEGLGHSNSRGRSAALDAAAAALGAPQAADAAPAASPEPLSKPRLRVQGADIILEDAASPKVVEANGGGAAQHGAPAEAADTAAAGAAGGAAAAGAAAAGAGGRPAALAGASSQQQQLLAGLPQQLLAGPSGRAAQSHEHELQLRLASRTVTGASNMAIASNRAPAPHGDDRWALGGRLGGVWGARHRRLHGCLALAALPHLHRWPCGLLTQPAPCSTLPRLQPGAARPGGRRHARRPAHQQQRAPGGGAGPHEVPQVGCSASRFCCLPVQPVPVPVQRCAVSVPASGRPDARMHSSLPAPLRCPVHCRHPAAQPPDRPLPCAAPAPALPTNLAAR